MARISPLPSQPCPGHHHFCHSLLALSASSLQTEPNSLRSRSYHGSPLGKSPRVNSTPLQAAASLVSPPFMLPNYPASRAPGPHPPALLPILTFLPLPTHEYPFSTHLLHEPITLCSWTFPHRHLSPVLTSVLWATIFTGLGALKRHSSVPFTPLSPALRACLAQSRHSTNTHGTDEEMKRSRKQGG